jgi:hypothetical protein
VGGEGQPLVVVLIVVLEPITWLAAYPELPLLAFASKEIILFVPIITRTNTLSVFCSLVLEQMVASLIIANFL